MSGFAQIPRQWASASPIADECWLLRSTTIGMESMSRKDICDQKKLGHVSLKEVLKSLRIGLPKISREISTLYIEDSNSGGTQHGSTGSLYYGERMHWDDPLLHSIILPHVKIRHEIARYPLDQLDRSMSSDEAEEYLDADGLPE